MLVGKIERDRARINSDNELGTIELASGTKHIRVGCYRIYRTGGIQT